MSDQINIVTNNEGNNISQNLKQVQDNIRSACARSGRDPENIVICAVSKTKPASDIMMALSCGQHLFGENYVQELVGKYEELGGKAEFHMIGHLQRNKVKYIIDKVSLIHSVDSVALAEQISKEAFKRRLMADILLEVNIAGEETKFGFTPENTAESVTAIAKLSNIRIRGLMTSAPYTEDPESNRIHFRNLKKLFDQIKELAVSDSLSTVSMDILSMGMTGDYEVAVEEGSTMLRIGTGIFGARA